MKKIFACTIIALLLIVTNTQSVSACSYILQTPQETYDQNDQVFIGKIIKTSVDGGLNGTRSVTFEVLKTYKGSLSQTVTLTTGANSAMCGFDEGNLVQGDIWVIHTSDVNSFNSLPYNQKYESLAKAQNTIDPLSKNETPQLCTLQYDPVCAQKDTGIRCVTTPCASTEQKTYGNACQAAVDKAEVLYKGECRTNSNPPAVTNPFQELPQDIDSEPQEPIDDEGMYPVPTDTYSDSSFGQKILESVKRFFNWLFWFN